MTSTQAATKSTLHTFEMQWPGAQRWELLMEQMREHFSGLEEWFEVSRTSSGKLQRGLLRELSAGKG